MNEKEINTEQEDEEQEEYIRQVRHTISAEETFTLAKDVYDIRSFILNIYKNRAVISRRLNIFSLICGIIFTMLYAAYNVWSMVTGKLSLGLEITVYALLAVYVILVILLLCVTASSNKANTKTVKKYNKALKYFRFSIRILSIAMAVVSIVVSSLSAVNSVDLALQVVLVIVSIVIIVIQAVPIIFGGIANLARWATSPAKGKTRFSKVLLEWYQLVCSGGSDRSSVKKVSPKYIEDIGRCIDGYLIPRMGKKYITEIDASAIYAAADEYPENERDIVEGVFKKVFAYAYECGYVNFNPTKDMGMEGSIDESKKKAKKQGKSGIFASVGKKIGKSIIKGVLGDDDDE
ncbi:MAG: hypothetical protein LUF82_00835 [Clostridia bacterium]|nr:hypothetical protein [Clostridia bacterium]